MATQAARRNPIPQASGEIPSQDKIFREFKGINTQAARESIDPDQFSWLENIMPIGGANAKVVAAPSTVKATLAATAYYRKGYNISNVNYGFYACTDGSAYQVNLTNYAITLIAAAGTFPSSGTQIAQWKNERILIINATNYYDWNGATLTVLGGTTSAPAAGQCIAVYASHVWISNGRTINFSKPASYTDFAAPGGNTIIFDSTLTSDIQQLLSANNFLYFFGVDSINVIADVSVNAAGTATLFSNTNISANSGTNLAQGIVPYYRAIWYMNPYGIFGLYGATPRKASDDLDGIFPLIDFTKPVTSGTVVVYNILCAAFMFTYNDPVTATARKLIALYFNKKWFVASQGDSLIGLMTNNEAGIDNFHGDDGTHIYDLFSSTTTAITSKLETALWDFGEMVREKQALKIGVETNTPAAVAALSPTVDTESSSQAPNNAFASSLDFIWYGVTTETGPHYAAFQAVAGNYASTPNSAAVDILGDIDIQVRVAMDDWTPATQQVMVSKTTTFSIAYDMLLNTNGTLNLTTTPDGLTPVSANSTVAPTVADGAALWLRATRDVNNGAAGNTTTFYTSNDGVTWTQLGAAVVIAGTTSIFNNSGLLALGGMNGKMYRSKLFNGIEGVGGLLAADFNPADAYAGQTIFVSVATGETYTMNGTSVIVAPHVTDPTAVFPWTNQFAAVFTWLSAGYVWLIGSVDQQGHYLGITITSETPQNQYIGLQLQYRMLPGGWWD